MLGGIGAAQQTVMSGNPQQTEEPITLSLKDGELLVEQGPDSSHPLADSHCDRCSAVFIKLKTDADKGIRPELFSMAVEQSERQKRVLGAVAQPGIGALDGLSATGKIRAVDEPNASSDGPRVSVSREGARRAARMAEMAKRLGIGRDESPSTAAQIETSDSAGATSAAREDHSAAGRETADSESKTGATEARNGVHTGHTDDEKLTPEELKQIEDLEKRDAEVRAHEQAHKGAAGAHGGAISYTYQTGPNGKKYAIGGEVPVDIAPIKGDPKATISKMQTIRRAALAPADPSSADRRIAARATQYVVEAQAELMTEELEAPKTLAKKNEDDATTSDPPPVAANDGQAQTASTTIDETQQDDAADKPSAASSREGAGRLDDLADMSPNEEPSQNGPSNRDAVPAGPTKFEAGNAHAPEAQGAPVRRALRQYGAIFSGPSRLNTYG
ncbi:MAG: putative metalloprotease CJM1_0395 family protein [Myxococcota bacterium]|nr:putative metalloprotease CJM1_0395 family protein [Myxococcota bacterium]